MLGLAVGDALGTTLEFTRPGTFTTITEIVGGGPFHLDPGQWTDDTSMALCLAESLIERQAFDPIDQLQRYTRWWQEGYLSSNGRCFDIGIATKTALSRFMRTGEAFCGSTDTHSAGNGSLMRLAPIALCYASTPVEVIRLAGDSSRTTHAATECVDACRYMAGLLIGALGSEPKDRLLANCYEPFPEAWAESPLVSTIAEVASGSFRRRQPPEIQGSGYVVRSLEAALWAFHNTDNFEQAVLNAVNLGDDADTTGAICGQLAGAYYGVEGIPKRWRSIVSHRELIESFAKQLVQQKVRSAAPLETAHVEDPAV